jgi:malonyl-CoA O-methyltransferase
MSPTPPQSGRPAYDSRRLRRIFDRRAATFDDVAFLPREISQRMRERLDYIKVAPAAVLDAGCGAGEDIPALRERFPEAPVFGTDLSRGMLTRALRHDSGDTSWRRFLPATLGKALGARGPRFAQADFAALPFAAGAFEFIWSNLALHWHSRPDHVFPEWQRVLKVNGLLMFSTLGPDTLKELRAAAGAERVHRFIDMHDWGDMLVQAGFGAPVMDMELLTLTYADAAVLLADLRSGGQTSARADRPRGLARKDFGERLRSALQLDRNVAFAATYEVVYGHGWKTAPRKLADGRDIVEFRPRFLR